MIVRDERPDDAAAIRGLLEAGFGGTVEADLVERLHAGGHVEMSLVAEGEGRIIGHVLFSPLEAPEHSLALGPVSVLPGRQRQGIGSRLIREGLARARRDGWRSVFVLGEPAYYGRFGFRVDVAAAFKTPYPPAYFMALELDKGALAGKGGPVVYAPPFAQLG